MALEQSLDKIPVRIIRSKNQLGKFQDDIIMDCNDAISFGPSIRTKIYIHPEFAYPLFHPNQSHFQSQR